MENWESNTKRFVLFMDIVGFKDMISRNTHIEVLNKLKILRKSLDDLSDFAPPPELQNTDANNQTKSVIFSDSIIFFSKGDSDYDVLKIIYDAFHMIKIALENGIFLKGALSYGQINVDFENSLFFGQPIIDAYLLEEELQLLTVVLDNFAEKRCKEMVHPIFAKVVKEQLVKYKANLKSGKITHTLIKPMVNHEFMKTNNLEKLFDTSHGKPRLYIDNTIDYINTVYP